MRSRPRKQQSGFTIVELIISTCILAILASVAIKEMHSYQRRATLSEVVLAANQCKNMVTESYPTFDSSPPPGGWGCESNGGTRYTSGVQTSPNGVIRVGISGLDANMNGRFVYLIPARSDGATPMTTPEDLGNGVRSWICGSDLSFVREALPANCRNDTAVTASTETFGP